MYVTYTCIFCLQYMYVIVYLKCGAWFYDSDFLNSVIFIIVVISHDKL